MSKKISHVEIYYEDSSMEKISNEKTEKNKFTKEQLEWIKEICLCDLNNFKICYSKIKDKVTIENYKKFPEDDFYGIGHSEYLMIISMLDRLK